MSVVLFGAGAAGKYALDVDGHSVVAFADNDARKWGKDIKGIPIQSPFATKKIHGDADWVACAISRPAAVDIRSELRSMGVKTLPLWKVLPVHHGLPPGHVRFTLKSIMSDVASINELVDQLAFRANPDYDRQIDPSPNSELYFPDFIAHRDDERFIDCGAADGDTMKVFMERWDKWKSIVAFEPDSDNYNKMCRIGDPEQRGRITHLGFAVSDFDGYADFTANADYSSRLGGGGKKVRVTTIDQMCGNTSPTYIKMDVEGAELEALWGARKTLKKHKPVLAICAYHASEHLWQIPILIQALQPEYKMYLRRYAEGAFELVWYAVPMERIR